LGATKFVSNATKWADALQDQIGKQMSDAIQDIMDELSDPELQCSLATAVIVAYTAEAGMLLREMIYDENDDD
jgi:hypothetical protein